MRSVSSAVVLAALFASAQLAAQAAPPAPQADPPAAQAPPPLVFNVTVVGTTPLPGVELPLERIPAPVQTSTAADIERSGALDVSDFANRRLNGVHVNEMQGNPFQSDVSYRGYTASPLLGTPQGLSVYMDGVRLNQPFGDVVSWDLIPRIAIASSTLMPGSNPLFGLNTLGGALSLQTKDGASSKGTTVQASYGSNVRRAVEFEHGGAGPGGLNWYLAGSLFGEDGWRDDSPSDVRQVFGKLGWAREGRRLALTVAHADNALTGNGLQETRLLDRDYASVYTKPDHTDNRSTLVNLSARRTLGARVTFSGNLYYRDIRTGTLNGDVNEDSLDQALYQPDAAERAALAAAGYTGVPAGGADASNTPFPSWRCIANVLLGDAPAETCNGLLNRTRTSQHNAGVSGQVTRFDRPGGHGSQLTAGAAFDRGRAAFTQTAQLGFLNPDRSVTGLPAFGDGVTGGGVDGEPFDARVDLDGLVRTWSVFASETVSIREAWHVTVSGRYNRTSIANRDALEPGGGPGSLDGDHVFSRFNPAAGVTFSPARAVNVYVGYSEGSRAATSIELGCADPQEPCKLPNAMAGDPPLDQVVTRTVDTGVRGQHGAVSWNGGVFLASNRDDILFVQSEQSGFGYFTNVGRTRRQGIELGASRRIGRVDAGAGYTWLDATFQSGDTLNGGSNSSNDLAGAGVPGLEGAIELKPGDRMPLVPRHMLKMFADVQVTGDVDVDVDVVAMSSSYARGNENNRHEADGTYYLGAGAAEAYAVVNLGARYRIRPWLQLLAQVNNLFDRRYHTAAQLGPVAFTSGGAFVARPFPAVGGEFPVAQGTFFAPGAPMRAWFGTRVRF